MVPPLAVLVVNEEEAATTALDEAGEGGVVKGAGELHFAVAVVKVPSVMATCLNLSATILPLDVVTVVTIVSWPAVEPDAVSVQIALVVPYREHVSLA